MQQYQVDSIYSFKLTSGEEIVARVAATDAQDVSIENPITMALTSKGLQMLPSLMSADSQSTVQLNTSNVIMSAPARQDVANHWIEATTGIKPVSKQILTG